MEPDKRTGQAIERQARTMGMSPNDYLCQVLAGNEEATIVTDKGELTCAEFTCHRAQ